jgi:hypothetical protein
VGFERSVKPELLGKRILDDFLSVLKWTTDFGVDTEDGRELKKGVVPVFAAGTYDPKEKLMVNGERITISLYSSRMNIKLLRPADFNERLREHQVDKRITVQRICSVSKDESDLRTLLDAIWEDPLGAKEKVEGLVSKNRQVFGFEELLTGLCLSSLLQNSKRRMHLSAI